MLTWSWLYCYSWNWHIHFGHTKISYFISGPHIICILTWSWHYVFNINGIKVYKTLKLVSGPHDIWMPTWSWWHLTYAFLKSDTHFIFNLCLPGPECIWKNSLYVKLHIFSSGPYTICIVTSGPDNITSIYKSGIKVDYLPYKWYVVLKWSL